MKCQKCDQNNWAIIKKKQSKQEVKDKTEVQFMICKTCEPHLSLQVGFESVQQLFSDYNQKQYLKDKESN